MPLKIYPTLDHSNTLYDEELDETYHSRNGALEESQYVFIEKGLNQLLQSPKKELKILEVGFGTGLNSILTFINTKNIPHCSIQYDTLETAPLPFELVNLLNYNNFLSEDYFRTFKQMHHQTWDKPILIDSNFTLQKINMRLQDFVPSHQYDLIYFDAFAPDKQPEMWTIDVFAKLFLATKRHGVLVTYSSKGEVKRNLRSVGFEVERLPGPPRKRHMLRASKI